MFWGSPKQILIDFQLNSNWILKETALRQPRANSNWFSIEFELKFEGNCSGAAIARSFVKPQYDIGHWGKARMSEAQLFWEDPKAETAPKTAGPHSSFILLKKILTLDRLV